MTLIDRIRMCWRFLTKKEESLVSTFVTLQELYIKIKNTYHNKKLELLEVNRMQRDKEKEKELVYHINVLGDLLSDEQVDMKNIHGTLNAYPNETNTIR